MLAAVDVGGHSALRYVYDLTATSSDPDLDPGTTGGDPVDRSAQNPLD
jgi:hypothetical protein